MNVACATFDRHRDIHVLIVAHLCDVVLHLPAYTRPTHFTLAGSFNCNGLHFQIAFTDVLTFCQCRAMVWMGGGRWGGWGGGHCILVIRFASVLLTITPYARIVASQPAMYLGWAPAWARPVHIVLSAPWAPGVNTFLIDRLHFRSNPDIILTRLIKAG